MSARSKLVRQLPCVCCELEDVNQHFPTQEHHCNKFELAGKERRGNDYSVPLCDWHHVGRVPVGMTADLATYEYGPSLARSKKRFRETYGSDEHLIELTNEALAKL